MTPPPYGPPPGYGPPGGAAPNNTLGLVGMILGIVSIPLVCCPYLGIPVGIAGAVLGHLGKGKAAQGLANNRGQAQAGFICGIIGAVLGVVLLILSFSVNALDLTTYYDVNN